MNVGIAGLGDMGGAMMDRLLDAKRNAYGYNRTKAKTDPYVRRGMHAVDSPRELAQRCDASSPW